MIEEVYVYQESGQYTRIFEKFLDDCMTGFGDKDTGIYHRYEAAQLKKFGARYVGYETNLRLDFKSDKHKTNFILKYGE
jgi:hypothetical protein